jgi:hypothetical protein
MSISIEADESEEIKDALEAAADGEIAPAVLVEQLAEGVTLLVSFSSGESFRYFNVPADDAISLLSDASGYNHLLRGNTNSERIS